MGLRTELPLLRWRAIGYKPQPWQLERLHMRTERIKTLTTARQVGKSYGGGALIDELMNKGGDDRGPAEVGVLAPTLGKAKLMVDKYIDFVGKAFGASYFQTNLQDHKLWVPTTGATLRWMSADEIKSVVGFTFTDAVTDESQDIPDIVFNRWFPTLGIRKASLTSFGTPDITPDQTWFKAQYIRGQDEGYEDHWSANVTAYECEYWSPEDILLQKETLSEREFRMLMLGEWVDEEGSALSGYPNAIIAGEPEKDPQPEPGKQYAIGLDLAVYEDFTVAIIGERSTRTARHMVRWNSTDAFTTYDRIQALSEHWNNAIIVADETGIGVPMVRELRERGLRVTGVKITAGNKLELISELNADMEHRRVMFPNWPALVREFKALVYHATPSGKLTADAAAGFHDDCVWAAIFFNKACKMRPGTGSGFNIFDSAGKTFRRPLSMIR